VFLFSLVHAISTTHCIVLHFATVKYLIKSGASDPVHFCIIYVLTQQMQGQLQKQHSVDVVNYITDKLKHKENSHRVNFELNSKAMEQLQGQHE
jgi:hypothetical protein